MRNKEFNKSQKKSKPESERSSKGWAQVKFTKEPTNGSAW